MNLVLIQALGIGWILTCLVGPSSGNPQQQYWALPQVGIAINHPKIENRFPLRIDYERHYQGSENSGYESIDQFQLEQRRQPQIVPEKSEARYDYEDAYFNQFQSDQESYYQSLLRVTENPLRDLQNHDTLTSSFQEPQTYYQDYLTLDDTESLNVEQSNSRNKHNDQKNFQYGFTPSAEKMKDSKDEKIAGLITKLLLKDNSYAPSLNDLEVLNSLEDKMIAEASVPEEIKREVRQVRGQQPGILWTLARLAFEKVNDTKSAANQIGTIINENFSPDDTSTSSSTTTTTTTSTTSSSLIDSNSADTSSNIATDGTTTTTTTEAPFRLTRTILQGIIRRNLKGLIRLFNIEWRDALSQSQVSVREFQRDLGNQIRPYLEDNPKVN